MSLKINRFTRTTLAVGILGFTLTACDDEFSLTKLGNKIDRPPSAIAGETDTRPPADQNGVITYPNYQVAVARDGDTVATVASRVGISADRLARYNGLKTDTRQRPVQRARRPSRRRTSSPHRALRRNRLHDCTQLQCFGNRTGLMERPWT